MSRWEYLLIPASLLAVGHDTIDILHCWIVMTLVLLVKVRRLNIDFD